MTGEGDFRPRKLADGDGCDWPRHTILGSAYSLRARLLQLAEERILVREQGLADNSAYVEDLELEACETRAAYAAAVITELALLRADLDAPNRG